MPENSVHRKAADDVFIFILFSSDCKVHAMQSYDIFTSANGCCSIFFALSEITARKEYKLPFKRLDCSTVQIYFVFQTELILELILDKKLLIKSSFEDCIKNFTKKFMTIKLTLTGY